MSVVDIDSRFNGGVVIYDTCLASREELELCLQIEGEFERGEDNLCGCHRCVDIRLSEMKYPQHNTLDPYTLDPFPPGWRYTCEICGNKRCPHHTDHNLACTNSNEVGEPGSDY